MRVHLLANPAAGGGDDAAAEALEARGATLVEPDAAERIVVAGGDGSIAPAAALAVEHAVPLAVLPTGTANDFARAASLPPDLDAAADLAVHGTVTQCHDLAAMDDRPFVNVAAAGLAPAAARRAAPLKRLLGPLAYPAGALAAGLLDRPIAVSAPPYFTGPAWQVAIACGGAFGGGAAIDAAVPDDRELDLLVIPAGRRIALARYAVALRRGTLADAPGVVHARTGRLTVELPAGTHVDVDGEVLLASPRHTFCVTGVFRLVVEAVRQRTTD